MSPQVITTLTLAQVAASKEDQKNPKQKVPYFLVLDYSVPWGYLDYVRQGHPPSIGVGAAFFLNQNHYINIRYAPRGGSNNKEQLIALWTLLETTKKKDIR